ncbi:prolyl oligopeptidase family serine peptidase [candidate division KSB1 bacterium]|nr:prolyl oligopeptidase family serine peptidase [candidate division KSB1 bacterium]
MHGFEITFRSLNSEPYAKPITALVLEPEYLSPNTGVMLVTHGWSGNRFQNQDKMEYVVERFDLICISVEFRQSGYDFDPITGLGSYRPYDASFLQVFDVLNALREVLILRPEVNRMRLFHYGGSQGGHIALLSAIFAPHTFAFVYASSPLTHLDEKFRLNAGREFAGYECAARDAFAHADRIQCPVFIEHGTNDSVVDFERHTRAFVEKLLSLKKPVTHKYYPGGGHQLEPVASRLEAFKSMGSEPLQTLVREEVDDFEAAHKIEIPCADRVLQIDWSQKSDSINLFTWLPR